RHRLMAADAAADAEVVRVDDRAVDLDLLALDAEVGDPVLAAAVRAARDVDPELLIEARQTLLERLHELAREALRLGERELAELRAGARDGATPERRGVEREAGRLELAPELLGTLAANIRDQEILHAGGPDRAGAVALGQIGDDPQLVGREASPQHGDADVAVARLALGMDADVVAVGVVRRIVGHARRQRRTEARVQLGLEALGRPSVLEEEELQASALAVLAK